jgi:poly(beta-D-mannuronate) lyase
VGTFPFVTDDMDGQPRTAPYDVGADERASTAVLQRPLTPAVVGPDSP